MTRPTTAVGHTSSGNSGPGATTEAQSEAHPRRPRSYSGEHWLADHAWTCGHGYGEGGVRSLHVAPLVWQDEETAATTAA